MKILVIDDESVVRLSLKRVLVDQGHDVKEAADGEAGYQIWQNWQPEIVLLDVLMPGLNGPEVLKKMGPYHSARVILMSAFVGSFDGETVQTMGAHNFLVKPFANIFEIVKLIEKS